MQVLDFVLPRGERGYQGPTGEQGSEGPEGPQGIPSEALSKKDVIALGLDMKRRGTI